MSNDFPDKGDTLISYESFVCPDYSYLPRAITLQILANYRREIEIDTFQHSRNARGVFRQSQREHFVFVVVVLLVVVVAVVVVIVIVVE